MMKTIAITSCFLLLLSCSVPQSSETAGTAFEQGKTFEDSVLYGCRKNIDSITVWQSRFEQSHNKRGEMLALKLLGNSMREKSKFLDALDYHRRALKIAEKLEDLYELTQINNQIGTDYRRIGMLDEASSHHYRALSYWEKTKDKSPSTVKKNRVISLNGLGNIYLTLDNKEAAENIFRQALEGEKELNSDLGQAINYANIGFLFEGRGMIDSARAYYQLSMDHNTLAQSNLGISLCHVHFGRLAENEGLFDLALKEYKAANQLMEQSHDKWHWMESGLSIARVYLAMGDMVQAQKYIYRALCTATEIHSFEFLSAVYHLRYLYFEKMGDSRNALKNYQMYRNYADSVTNIGNVNQMHNLHIKYEAQQSEQAIADIQKEKRLNTYLSLAVVIALFIALIALFLYLRWIRQKKQLAEKELLLLRQEKQLAATEAVLEGEVKERTRIARDLHDGLGSLLSAIKMNLGQMKNGAVSEKEEVILFNKSLELLDKSIDELRRIAHNLMPGTLYLYGLKPALSDFCDSIPSVQFLWCGKEDRLDPNLEVAIYRVIHELVNNALKHAMAEHIVVQIVQEDDRIAFTVQDDGKGFDVAAANGSAEATGMGLSSIRFRIASFGGTLDIVSSPEEGTEVNGNILI
ncbi:MAG: sensor histidine kinase [Bacteroidales bacterium]|jgi:signal transduction histidine kinase|nr:sensor histidine kinase [Bacteroidales bacterium]